jgi:hypothetical protein
MLKFLSQPSNVLCMDEMTGWKRFFRIMLWIVKYPWWEKLEVEISLKSCYIFKIEENDVDWEERGGGRGAELGLTAVMTDWCLWWWLMRDE